MNHKKRQQTPATQTAQGRVLKQQRLTAAEEVQQIHDAGVRREAERTKIPRRRLSVAEEVEAIQNAAVAELKKRHDAELAKAAKTALKDALPVSKEELLEGGERLSFVDMDFILWENIRASLSPDRFPFSLDEDVLPELVKDHVSLETQSEALAEHLLKSFKAGKGDPFDLLDTAPRSTSPGGSDSSDEWDPNSKLPYMPRLKLDKRIANALVMVAAPIGQLQKDLRAHDQEVIQERYRPWPSAREAMAQITAEIVAVGAEKKLMEREEIGPAPLGFSHLQFNDIILSTDGSFKLKPKAPAAANETTRPIRLADTNTGGEIAGGAPTDGEAVQQGGHVSAEKVHSEWAYSDPSRSTLREMGPGRRQNVLDDNQRSWDLRKHMRAAELGSTEGKLMGSAGEALQNQGRTITHAEVDDIRRRIGYLLHNLTSPRASQEGRRHIRRRIELLLIESLGIRTSCNNLTMSDSKLEPQDEILPEEQQRLLDLEERELKRGPLGPISEAARAYLGRYMEKTHPGEKTPAERLRDLIRNGGDVYAIALQEAEVAKAAAKRLERKGGVEYLMALRESGFARATAEKAKFWERERMKQEKEVGKR
ncbi:hypothetical protein B0H16DRAFT_1456172 [Mycena metata]|uniref:Uncharacterized protein n=1 Tax=Mycena metata TaxID=1033252 RepID=A0AAD7JE02_9AGAR|nr:hypothetical protein B0H16DRAFT_1456172 [Mycena metata]